MMNNVNQIIRSEMFMPTSRQWLPSEGAVKQRVANR